ncbi:MAG: ATP synthase F1 subunit delta [Chitinophagaceae bacterium]|nr:ATP synthase F1 subunit delta [Chitinophagaceae bacterium]
MPNPRLAGRYAKSLIDLSIEKGQLEAVYADMKYLQELCKKSREFVNLMRSPIVRNDQKNAILLALTKGKISEITAAFSELLVRKGREGDLPEIAVAFVEQYNALKGIHVVTLTAATELTAELKAAIESKVKTTQGFPLIELETKVNEKLIGGFVLEFDNKLVDASILNDLKEIKNQFLNNQFVVKI